jgi:hypothetical protein
VGGFRFAPWGEMMDILDFSLRTNPLTTNHQPLTNTEVHNAKL